MSTDQKCHKAILLSLVAFLYFLGCGEMENETPSSFVPPTSPSEKLLAPDLAHAFGGTTSTTGFPIIDLGALVNPKPECAYGVNASGKVVGQAGTQSGPPHAFLWSRDLGAMDLGSLGDPEYSTASDINDHGQIAGTSWEPGTTQLRAFLWSADRGMVNLGTSGHPSMPPADAFSIAFGINNQGEIVGDSDNFAFLWTEKRGMVLLGSLWDYSAAWDINDHGQVVGISQIHPPDQYHAVLWTDVGEMVDLGTLRLNSQALGINNRGEIVGGSSNRVVFPHETICNDFGHSCVAVIWTKQYGISPLPTLGGDAGSAHAINEIGQVVGWSYTATNEVHAFLWTSKSGIKDLGTLPGAAVQESVAYNINNRGQVVGYAVAEDGTRHAVIWTVR